MVTPELKWPMMNLTPSPNILLATDTPCLGSEASSPNDSSICWPLMPPLALMSAAACSAPFFSWAPNAALGPVSGPATPTLICAEAPLAPTTTAAAMASAGQNTFFIRGLPSLVQRTPERARTPISRRMIQRKLGNVTINCRASSAVQRGSDAHAAGGVGRQPSGPRRRNSQPYWTAIWRARTSR